MLRSLFLPVLILTAACALAQELQPAESLLADDFSRFTAPATALGTIPGTTHAWVRRVPVKDGAPLEGLVTGGAGELHIGYASGDSPQDTGVAAGGFTVADAVVSLKVGASRMPGRPHYACLSYRGGDAAAAAGARQEGAYHVELAADWGGSRDLVLRYGKEQLAVADVAAVHPPEASYLLRVAFAGDHHQVWLDGTLLIDYWETTPGRTGAGAVGFGGFYSSGSFDDFRVCGVRVPAGGGQARPPLAPLLFQGRPFFVLGTFDPPRAELLDEWLAAGCNTTLFHVCDPKATPKQRRATIEADLAWGRAHGVALIYYPQLSLLSERDGKPVPTLPDDLPARRAVLQEMLQVTAGDPQTFGYWTFDEPENHLHASYQDWEQRKDTGLAEWMAGGLQWVYDTLKAGDPDGYVMPTLGWWTTYEPAAAMYDVNVPNEYPARGAPLSGPLYNAVYDAAKAADAARVRGRAGFVYMPPCFDVIDGPWRAATLREFRYLCFAPLTQGAQGLLPWRLNRATPAYQRAVVYPVFREIKPLVPWLTGQAVEGKVTSTADATTVDYLRKFPVRVRTVAGEKLEQQEVPGVSDCSYLLRRRPDNTYLLLAVSNRKEPQTVTFTLSGLGELPASARETIEFAQTPIEGGKITDTFEPFGVRAWVIEPK